MHSLRKHHPPDSTVKTPHHCQLDVHFSPQQYLDARLTARELPQDTFDMPEPETKGGDHHTCSSGPAATFTLTLPAQRTTEKISKNRILSEICAFFQEHFLYGQRRSLVVVGTGFWTSILSLGFWAGLSQITRFWTNRILAAVPVLKSRLND